MRTIGWISALLVAALSPLPILRAQAPPTLALNAMPFSMPDFNAPALLTVSAGSSHALLPLPEAPMPAITALPSAKPCRSASQTGSPDTDSGDQDREPCLRAPNPYMRFVSTSAPLPLSPAQKAHLALHDLTDPGNLATILATAGFTIATNARTAYGPGWIGVRNMTGYSLSQDTTGEFFGTFLIPSLTGQDPRYRRMPNATIPRRIVHTLAATVVSQSDDGRTMPNYANLLTNPICSEISNLYVPGVNGNGPSTVARVLTGYATSPVDNLITEFLPDVARRVHVRVIFVQSLLNQISNDQYSLP